MRGTNRRKFLKLASAAGVASTAGCLGGGGGGDEDFQKAVTKLGLEKNWEQRRFTNAQENWPMAARKKTPPRDASGWKDSKAFQSAVKNDAWAPPKGWDKTAAGDVEQVEVINHGAVNMQYDPATLATHQLFEEQTGIKVKPIEVGVTKANQKEQQVLSSKKKTPVLMNVNGPLIPAFAQQGWLEITNALYPESVWSKYIPALRGVVQWDLGKEKGTHTYGFPNIAEGTVGHLRPDLLKEQGIDPKRLQGEWTWDDLEAVMKAFKDTGVYAYAYYAGTPTYLSYSYRELLYQQGGRMVQPDGTVKVDTEASIEVIRRMKKWRDNGWVPGDVINYTEGDIVDLFLSGQLAFTTAFTDFVSRALTKYKPGKEYRAVLPPKATTGPKPGQRPLIGPNGTCINPFADTDKKLAAMLYGDLRLSYPSQWWELTYESNLSYAQSVYKDAAEGGVIRFGDVIGNAVENGFVELFPQMSTVFQKMSNPVQRAIIGKISPEEAMAEVQKFVDQNINNS